MDADAPSGNRRGSQETLISLMQLDPAPIETPPAAEDVDKELPDLPVDDSALDDSTSTIKPPSTTSAPGLSGSASAGRGSVYYRASFHCSFQALDGACSDLIPSF